MLIIHENASGSSSIISAPADRWSNLVSRDQKIFLAILIFGAFLRIYWNDVSQYSRADEQVYVNYSNHLMTNGWSSYRKLTEDYVNDPAAWVTPNPLRCGYLALTTTLCHLSGSCDHRTLAWLSTVAGIACIAITFFLGLEVLGVKAALIAAALTCTSPLQLAMGRRALQDELFCTTVIAVLWLLMRIVRHPKPPISLYLAAIITMTFALSYKETFLLLLPAYLILFLFWRGDWSLRRADAALFALPPLLFAAGFMLATRSLTLLFRVGKVFLVAAIDNPYVKGYQQGPPHRDLVDHFILAPLVVLAAAGATALLFRLEALDERGARGLALFLGLVLLLFAVSPVKNIRYTIFADPVMRLLAAWLLIALTSKIHTRENQLALIFVLAINAAAELWIFHRIFIVSKVYDPVTFELLRALKAIPSF